jgi:hypothetical protein
MSTIRYGIGGTPEDPLGNNPFAQGTLEHQQWEDVRQKTKDMLRWTKEHLALLGSETLGSMPPEEASPKQFSDHLLKALADKFDVNVRGLLKGAALTDDAADAVEHLLGVVESLMLTQAANIRVSFIANFSSELTIRLDQRRLYWTSEMLRMVRENKETNRLNGEPKPTGDPTPAADKAAPQPAAGSNANGCGPPRGQDPRATEPWHIKLRAARNKANLSRTGAAKSLKTKGIQITPDAIKKHEEGAAMPRPNVRRGYESIYTISEGEIFPREN